MTPGIDTSALAKTSRRAAAGRVGRKAPPRVAARVLPRAARATAAARFLGYRPAAYSLVLIVLLVAISLMAPLLTPYGRDAMDLDHQLGPPSAEHALGTDELGRDVLTRLIHAGRFSLAVAFCAVAVALVAGVAAGTVAGFFGGAADAAITMLMDLFLSVPVFLVLLVAASAGRGHLWLIPLVIGGTSWVETARVVRSLVLSLREEAYVDAARAIGARDASLIVKHLLPQALPAVIVSATVGFAQATLVESALSFLGFGVQPPVPTWGNMLQNAHSFIRQAPLAAFAPGFMIFITCLSLNYVGEGLRKALAVDRSAPDAARPAARRVPATLPR